MNTRKTVYNKLFKVETQLAKHKVELALADEIKASLTAYKGLKDGVDKTKNAAKNSFIKYIDSVRVAYQNSKNSVDLIDQLELKAKEEEDKLYQVFNDSNEIVQRAVKIISSKEYNSVNLD